MGLTNNQQAVFSFVSALFLAVSVVSVPLGVSPYVTFSLGVIGAIGLFTKEYLGSVPTTISNQVTTPDAETVTQLKQDGDVVFANPNYSMGVVYRWLGTFYDVYGNSLGSTAPAGTGSQL